MWSCQAGGKLGPTGPHWMAAVQVSDVDLALVAMPHDSPIWFLIRKTQRTASLNTSV